MKYYLEPSMIKCCFDDCCKRTKTPKSIRCQRLVKNVLFSSLSIFDIYMMCVLVKLIHPTEIKHLIYKSEMYFQLSIIP